MTKKPSNPTAAVMAIRLCAAASSDGSHLWSSRDAKMTRCGQKLLAQRQLSEQWHWWKHSFIRVIQPTHPSSYMSVSTITQTASTSHTVAPALPCVSQQEQGVM
jgi:hypothetical protein